MSEEISFTQEQLDEQLATAKSQWETEVLKPLQTERDELLQFKPKDLSDEEKAIQTKQQELFNKEIELELKSSGLEQFASIVKVSNTDELKEVIKSLGQIVNDIKVSAGYVPSDHAKTDEFSKFEKDKNTVGMIGTKLASLFK